MTAGMESTLNANRRKSDVEVRALLMSAKGKWI